jgi:hypothetical protein
VTCNRFRAILWSSSSAQPSGGIERLDSFVKLPPESESASSRRSSRDRSLDDLVPKDEDDDHRASKAVTIRLLVIKNAPFALFSYRYVLVAGTAAAV